MLAKNDFRVRLDGVVQVKLTQGQVALVDPKDWKRIRHRKWYAAWDKTRFYARARPDKTEDPKRPTLNMHREILKAKRSQQVDHVNQIGTDNRRSNIRLCTSKQNNQNRRKRNGCISQYKGIQKCQDGEAWTSSITIDGTRTYLGTFETEEEAALAYNSAALEYFGEFACINRC